MTIASLDDYIASVKTYPIFWKSAGKGTNVFAPFTVFDLAGMPSTGTLAVGNTANGLVPTCAENGFPMMPTLSNTGYLSRVIYSNICLCNIAIYDKLFHCGAYSFNANVTLSAQPSYSGRVPGANYAGLELWFECVTAFTGTPSIQINYLDQDGNTGDTGVIALPLAMPQGRMFRMPLAAGDTGIQQITQVRGTIATVGTFNMCVMRPLWQGRIGGAYEVKVDDLLKTGLPQVYSTSALYVVVTADSTNTQTPYFQLEIADK